MAAKVLQGDPKVDSVFRQRTKINLRKDDRTVVVLCSVPEYLRSQYTALDRDIVDGVNRRFRVREIPTVPSGNVSRWLNSVGGTWDSPHEIAQGLPADLIIHIDLDEVDFYEENSPELYRGRANGNVYVYESRDVNGTKQAFRIFEQEFRSIYPRHHPISADQAQLRSFQEQYVARVSDEVARLFYDYKPGDDVY